LDSGGRRGAAVIADSVISLACTALYALALVLLFKSGR
jgi:hypothetical protein